MGILEVSGNLKYRRLGLKADWGVKGEKFLSEVTEPSKMYQLSGEKFGGLASATGFPTGKETREKNSKPRSGLTTGKDGVIGEFCLLFGDLLSREGGLKQEKRREGFLVAAVLVGGGASALNLGSWKGLPDTGKRVGGHGEGEKGNQY